MIRLPRGRILRRLGLFYLLILLAALWVVTNRRFSVEGDEIIRRTGKEAVVEADLMQAVYESAGEAAFLALLEKRIGASGAERAKYSDHYYNLVSAENALMLSNVPEWNVTRERRLTSDMILLDNVRRPDAPEWWMLGWMLDGDFNPDFDLVLVERTLANGWALYVGRDTEFWNDLHTFYVVTSWLLVLVSVVALGAGMLTNRSILLSLGKINRMAREIVSTGDLAKRIPGEGARGDFGPTIDGLNLMLGKIEESVTSIRDASNNIAHDMRTPLTRLRNRLESLAKAGGGASPEEVEALIVEVDALLSTFRAIFRLSQVEMNARGLDWSDVDLKQVMEDAVALYDAVAEARGQRITFAGDQAVVRGESNLLFQLVSNLLDNACKYAPENSVIACTLRQEKQAGTVFLLIKDEGPGIPEAERSRVLERFYRMEKSRGNEGVGLGLSMVSVIAKAHGAELELLDGEPGLIVKIGFPRRETRVKP